MKMLLATIFLVVSCGDDTDFIAKPLPSGTTKQQQVIVPKKPEPKSHIQTVESTDTIDEQPYQAPYSDVEAEQARQTKICHDRWWLYRISMTNHCGSGFYFPWGVPPQVNHEEGWYNVQTPESMADFSEDEFDELVEKGCAKYGQRPAYRYCFPYKHRPIYALKSANWVVASQAYYDWRDGKRVTQLPDDQIQCQARTSFLCYRSLNGSDYYVLHRNDPRARRHCKRVEDQPVKGYHANCYTTEEYEDWLYRRR